MERAIQKLFSRGFGVFCICCILIYQFLSFLPFKAIDCPLLDCATNDTLLKQAKLISLLQREMGAKIKENEQLRRSCHLSPAVEKQAAVPPQDVKPRPAGLPADSTQQAAEENKNASGLPQPKAQPVASKGSSNPDGPVIGVLVVTCNRPQYLDRSVSQYLDMIEKRPDSYRFPVTVSQDGANGGVGRILDTFRPRLHEVIRHPQYQGHGGEPKMALTYARISQHYISSLTKMFAKYDQVIVLEDDLKISDDFFDYFSAFLPVLQSDPTLLCVSAWNDNGFPDVAVDHNMAYRTDVFPGLGWMITKKVFDGIKDKWPEAYWDEYMRDPDVRQGRQCIRPEVNRAITFGRQGSSGGEYFDAHLSRMVLNMENIDWAHSEDYVAIVRTQLNFDTYIESMLAKATVVKISEVDKFAGGGGILRIYYDDTNYGAVASKFRIMNDEKHGMRRTSYRHVVIIRWQTNHIFLTQEWP
eukprot:GEMP01021529.1.p1 GENE.GEMP01021529.1~~GEMP01021529.1.p1  ORF type:complete len:470 (+),score=92.71 GEMP01021529.1:108-1517(+)